MAGFQQTADIINNRAGSIAMNTRNVLDEIDRFQKFLDRNDNAALLAKGISNEDAQSMRAAFGGLSKLSRTARGQDTVPVADDLMFNAQDLWGVS